MADWESRGGFEHNFKIFLLVPPQKVLRMANPYQKSESQSWAYCLLSGGFSTMAVNKALNLERKQFKGMVDLNAQMVVNLYFWSVN